MKVRVEAENRIQEIEAESGKKLLELLRENDVYVPAYCSGRGTCGKCRVRVLSGKLEVTEADRRQFSEEELERGMRLACKAYPKEEVHICVEAASEEKMEILGVEGKQGERTGEEYHEEIEARRMIAIDIGTTTIAMALAEEEGSKILDSYTTINRQRMFGTDVLSRIAAANEEKGSELQRLIREDLSKGISKLIEKKEKALSKIVIAGNTTMVYLLLGYDCEELGKYPFQAAHLETQELTLEELLGKELLKTESEAAQIPVTILPGISAFVGGDITADLWMLQVMNQDFIKEEKSWLLLDLGTNGEMVLSSKGKLLAASTAAGPAFEGGIFAAVPEVFRELSVG